MGNIFSNEDKILRQQRNQAILGRDPRKIYGIYEQYGSHQINNYYLRPHEHRYRRKRNISFHGRYGKNDYLKTKSHSLNAILEELYTFGPEDYAGEEEEENKIRFEIGKPLIPRIKLKRSTSSLKDEKNYKALCEMSSESGMILGEENASINGILKKENDNMSRSENNITILLNDQTYDEISAKSDENYFTKNFDDCMKRLQEIEKDHELIENEDKHVEFGGVEGEKENGRHDEAVFSYKSDEYEFKDDNQNSGNGGESENYLTENSGETETTADADDDCSENKKPVTTSWYSNLKQQFEKTENGNSEPKPKEMSCRITGATLKTTANEKNNSEEEKEKEKRHYFSRLVKTNKSLIDEELPDPDKVKHIRAMFQETLNSTLKRKLDKKLGGSLQNISLRSGEQQMSRPLSAQCYRNDLYSEGRNCQKSDEEKDKSKERSSRDLNGEYQIENAKRKLFEKYEKDLKPIKDTRNKRILQPKWTDTGSVSSGISSDLSSYDTDLESYSREGTEQDEITVSDDDLLEEVKDRHYVQNEVLEKIRSFGTSVTYYGGEMITCSVGPLLSPTTQAIMEEIGEKYGSGTSPIRSFDEFYRKYIETNEHNRKKKLGRTRSFGQNDVFQKPNVLSNTEIELYKNDLEIEIGIKKPLGIPGNTLKRKVTKSASLGCKPETVEKTTEKQPEVIISTESVTQKEDDAPEKLSERDEIVKDVAEETPVFHPTENHEVSENKETEEEKSPEKEHFYSRSKSAPEGFSDSKIVPNSAEHPAKEIFFSYEKSIFNKKINPDMEFEEFEVCESLSEKLEKLEKINSHEKTATPDEEIQTVGGGETADEIQINAQEVGVEVGGRNEFNQNDKKETKCNYPKWPIETSVMVDIQKNAEQTPKIISSGKTVAKTKIRLF